MRAPQQEDVARAPALVLLEVVGLVNSHHGEIQPCFPHQATHALIVADHPIATLQRGHAILAHHADSGVRVDHADLALPVQAQRGRAHDQNSPAAGGHARCDHSLAALAQAHVVAHARAGLAQHVDHALGLVVAQRAARDHAGQGHSVIRQIRDMAALRREEATALLLACARPTTAGGWRGQHADGRALVAGARQFLNDDRLLVHKHELRLHPCNRFQALLDLLRCGPDLPGGCMLVEVAAQGAHGAHAQRVVCEADGIPAAAEITLRKREDLYVEQLREVVVLRRCHCGPERHIKALQVHELTGVCVLQDLLDARRIIDIQHPHAPCCTPPGIVGSQGPLQTWHMRELQAHPEPVKGSLQKQVRGRDGDWTDMHRFALTISHQITHSTWSILCRFSMG